MRTRFMRLFLFLLLCLPIAAMAQGKPAAAKPAPKPKAAAAKARAVTTHHSVMIDGQRVAYTATAGTIILSNPQQKPTASMFFIAYTEDKSDPASRPITFLYNGGPGAASTLVNFGGFGPRTIVWPPPGSTVTVRPPYRLEPNPSTLLATTDLVFVDAIGTGYSRILPPTGTPKMFYGVQQDANAFTQFIQRYLTKYGRWGSPKFLLGESYGTTRSAVLANELIHHGIYLNGVMLCSTVLNFPTITFAPGDDLPYILYLPSYATAAWYHHRLTPRPPSLSAFVAKVEAFAAGTYASALFQGSALSSAERASIAKQLAAFTGVRASLWLKSNLRISLPVFNRYLMGSQDETAGRYDSRYTIPDLQPVLPFIGTGDVGATSSAVMGALTASSDNYIETRLNYHSKHLYHQLNYAVNRAWDWKYTPPVQDLLGQGELFLNVAPALARALTNDPGMDVMVNNGYFDMATPFFATRYTFRHMSLSPGDRKRITWDYYDCGHMLYLNAKVLPVLSANINRFIRQASAN
jgi:carboxypeptidase C (cathepsin A)